MHSYTTLPKFTPFTLRIADRIMTFNRPVVMGILNITPDSFWSGSRSYDLEETLQKAKAMRDEGASILDIGGQSTRPGSIRISATEEIRRVIPAIEAIHSEMPEIPISIDTYSGEVASRALKAGATIINDISAGTIDPKIIDAAIENASPYVLMHMQGKPETMQIQPHYNDVTAEITTFFLNTTRALILRGLNDIILDPGIGFGKTAPHNLTLLRELQSLLPFELPILTGVSRKRFIQQITETDAEGALYGTTAMHALLLERGASILRVHDVKPAMDTVNVFCALHQIDPFKSL